MRGCLRVDKDGDNMGVLGVYDVLAEAVSLKIHGGFEEKSDDYAISAPRFCLSDLRLSADVGIDASS